MTIKDEDGQKSNAAEFSVSEISQALKRTVEETFGYVRVRGEVSGYRGPHSSGHAYFSLKDDKSRMDAVIWRGVFSKLRFKPEEGMEIIATGKLTTYPGSSKYQIVIERVEPAGVGALMVQLEERKKKLAAEGLFNEEHKKPLPFLPKVIGVVTSPTGAVIQDILHRIRDRFAVNVVVWPVRVQGETSSKEVAAAIDGFNNLPAHMQTPDLLIVARGGGSLEDLWGFNEEEVVRAAFRSAIPIISAVGHETDWTLLDLVADVRAPTPTGAAEIAVPVRHELIASIDSLGVRLSVSILRLIEQKSRALQSAARGLPTIDSLFALPRQKFDAIAQRLMSALGANTGSHRRRFVASSSQLRSSLLERLILRSKERLFVAQQRGEKAFFSMVSQKRQTLTATARTLSLVSYQNTLERGFVLVRGDDEAPIRSVKLTQSGQLVSLEFFDGKTDAVIGAQGAVKEASHLKLPKEKKLQSIAKKAKLGQGDLF